VLSPLGFNAERRMLQMIGHRKTIETLKDAVGEAEARFGKSPGRGGGEFKI
jgi:hypothetical protein